MKSTIGVSALALLFLGGLWLVAAPFVVGYQPRGDEWSDATVNDVWVGGLLTAGAFAALVAYAADALRELTRRD
ncbi:hypothetical protein ACFXJ8_12155 [Nonomuraea sp. NPDC059194]|uniref:hypothetical protein n=1 Tax=Nonomuraea sp. NPDC059194 TaxID=3346764 RepID=UPI003679F5CE